MPVQAGGAAKLRLAGVRVLGRLDLAFATVQVLLDFEHCWFDARFDICEATTGSIRFRGCFMEEFDASRATVGGELALQGCCINHLGLYGTRVGDLEIGGTTISAPGGVALYGDLLVATAAVYCHDTVFHGQVRLPGARISGYLRLNGATMAESSGAALYAPGLRVETSLFADRSGDGQDDAYDELSPLPAAGFRLACWPAARSTRSPTNSWPRATGRLAVMPRPAASCWLASGCAAGSRTPHRVCGAYCRTPLPATATGHGWPAFGWSPC